MHFGPGFFYDKNPKLVKMRLTEERLICVIEWDVVINKDFFDITIDSHLYFVDSIGIKVSLITKNSLNSEFLLGH